MSRANPSTTGVLKKHDCNGWIEVGMPYSKAPREHTEFGGGPGLIDPMSRKDRNVTAEESLMEIYATNPANPESDPATADLNYQPRPEPTPWPDPATAKGSTEA